VALGQELRLEDACLICVILQPSQVVEGHHKGIFNTQAVYCSATEILADREGVDPCNADTGPGEWHQGLANQRPEPVINYGAFQIEILKNTDRPCIRPRLLVGRIFLLFYLDILFDYFFFFPFPPAGFFLSCCPRPLSSPPSPLVKGYRRSLQPLSCKPVNPPHRTLVLLLSLLLWSSRGRDSCNLPSCWFACLLFASFG
jgi:hypothetical protein